jgi:hypothetical protein
MEKERMPKVVAPLAGLVMIAAAALLVPGAQANVSAQTSALPGATSAIEPAAATCVRQRVCGPRGCAWRTVCRRAPVRSGPRMMW